MPPTASRAISGSCQAGRASPSASRVLSGGEACRGMPMGSGQAAGEVASPRIPLLPKVAVATDDRGCAGCAGAASCYTASGCGGRTPGAASSRTTGGRVGSTRVAGRPTTRATGGPSGGLRRWPCYHPRRGWAERWPALAVLPLAPRVGRAVASSTFTDISLSGYQHLGPVGTVTSSPQQRGPSAEEQRATNADE